MNSTKQFTERERAIGKLMTMVWGSLESHILWTYKDKQMHGSGDATFHKQCIKDYAEQIKLLSQIL